MVQLMNRLGTFSEWGQAVVLNQLAKFVPQAPPRGRERGKQRESPFVLSYLILPYLILPYLIWFYFTILDIALSYLI